MATLSDDPVDKVQACLCHDAADPDNDLGEPYSTACREWFQALTEGERWRIATVLAAYERGAEADAQQLASQLPPAPRFPL